MSGYNLYWGDSHTNLHPRHLDGIDRSVESAKEMLDFWPIAYYPQETEEAPNGLAVEDWLPQDQLDREWALICDTAAANNAPGEFVAFAGYEWQGNATSGDHNVFYLHDHQPLLKSDTLAELYQEIRSRGIQAIAIPHHTAYMVGVRAKDWSVHDGELSPFAEIFSCHGCSESDEEWLGLRRNRHMGPGVSGGTIEDGLAAGNRFGIICSGDSHAGFAGVYGHGLMACYAEALTRESLWEAFSARRVYGVTADRIALTFMVNDAWMGEAIEARGPVQCAATVRGGDAVDRIELIRNNRVIATHCHNGAWDVPTGPERIRCKLRIEAGWGGDRKIKPDAKPRQWEGRLEVPEGAIVSVEKCWRNAGQRVEEPGRSSCAFAFTTGVPGVGTHGTQSNVFEIEARPSDRVILTIEGKRADMTLHEAMSRSRIIHYMDEAEAYIQQRFGVDPKALPRPDRIYYTGHKVKVHRAIPEDGLTASLVHEDPDPPDGESHYRVRVSQRNGNMAWSSPVWVTRR